jgi:uncharacterized cupin superfamily protein
MSAIERWLVPSCAALPTCYCGDEMGLKPRPNCGTRRCRHPNLQMPLVYSGVEAHGLGLAVQSLMNLRPGERARLLRLTMRTKHKEALLRPPGNRIRESIDAARSKPNLYEEDFHRMAKGQIVIAQPAVVDLHDAPIPAEWIIEGTPRARARKLADSADGMSSTVAWSCTAGRFHWHYYVDETVQILSGEVFITDEKGRDRRLGPGDMAFFPAGTDSVWRVPEEVRKLAMYRRPLPGRLIAKCFIMWNKVGNRLFKGNRKR